MSLNQHQFEGRVFTDPVYKETPNGKHLLTFTLMYFTRQVTDGKDSHANFISVEVWGNPAETLAATLQKGDNVICEGVVHQQRWEDKETGNKRSRYLYTANRVYPRLRPETEQAEPAVDEEHTGVEEAPAGE